MSEQDFKHAATDAKQTQVEATREIAEIIADLIKAALRERTGEESEKPKVEIFSSSNKVYPAREGNELSPEQVDDLLDKLANEQGSVRIYVEQNGKREKIFHQTQGEVKVDPLDLKAAMSEKLGPKLAERQQAKAEPLAEQQQESKQQPKEQKKESASKTSSSELGERLDFSRGQIPESLGIPELEGVDPAKLVEFDKDLAISWNYALSDVNQVNESRYSIGVDGASYKEAEAVQNIMQARNSIMEQIKANGYTNTQLREASQAKTINQSPEKSVEAEPSKVHETQATQESISSYEQSSDIPSLDHPEQPQPERELHDVGKVLEAIDNAPAPIPEKAQEKIDNAPAVYKRPTVDIEQGEQHPTVEQQEQQKVSAEITPSQGDRDQLNYPQETQSQTSNIDPAIQAAKAEFDRKLGEFQNNLDHFQSQVQKLSEQVAPLINDPNLKRWTQKASEQHRQAVQPIRNQISTVRQTVYNRLKNAGQALDNLGRKATEKLSNLQAKAIDKSVTWLVNSRYGKDTGRGGRVFEGDNQTFKKIGNNVIISRNSDKAELYSNGRYTKSANTQDKKAIAALPNKVVDLRQKLEQKQSQSQSQQKSVGRSR